MRLLLLLAVLWQPGLGQAAEGQALPQAPAAAVANESAEASAEPPADDCPYCTEQERAQLRVLRAQALAQELNRLLDEVERLAARGGATRALLSGLKSPEAKALAEALLLTGAPSRPRQGTRPRPVGPPPQIRAVYAQAGDPARGIAANAIVRVGLQDHVLGEGMSIQHGGRRLTLAAVREAEEGGLAVALVDERGKEVVLQWLQ